MSPKSLQTFTTAIFLAFPVVCDRGFSAPGTRYGIPSSTIDSTGSTGSSENTKSTAPSGFGASDLPNGWELTNPKRRPDPKGYSSPQFLRTAVGGGLGFPDLFPIEGYLFFGRHFGLRGYYGLPYPFKIRVELPADDITAKQGFKFANPDVTVNFNAVYGPQYGFDALYLPFGGAFYVGLGITHRRIHIDGGGESPLVICSASKPEPCSEQSSVIVTRTKVTLYGDVTTEAWMTRASAGWFWELGDDFYFNFIFGLTKPFKVERSVTITSGIDTGDNPSGQDLSAILKEVKQEKERDLESKTIEAIEPYDSRTLPLIGITLGLRL